MLTNAIEAVGLWVFLGLLTVLAIATSPLWIPAAVITGLIRGEASPDILRDLLFYHTAAAMALVMLVLVTWLGS